MRQAGSLPHERDPLQQFRPAHAEGGVVGAGEDATDFFAGCDDVVAEVAHGGPAAEDGAVVFLVHVDVAVGAVGRTEAAADAVAFDQDLFAIRLAVNGIDRAADQAVGVGATAAGGGDEPLVKPEAVADEAGDAAVSVGTGLGAFVAAGAGFQVEDEELLGIVEALVEELGEERAANDLS